MATLSLARLGRGALDLLYPRRCLLCSREGEFVCDDCLVSLPRAHGARCDVCWLPLDEYDACPQYADHPTSLSRLRSAFIFRDDVRRLIHAFKFDGQSCLIEMLGARLAESWLASGLQADVIVPVPLSGRRERTRGYNQSRLLANELSKPAGLPVAQALRRARFAGTQVGRARIDRRSNMDGSFAIADVAEVAGRRVLLIDDIATTGSTLDACARVLLAADAASVIGLTLARED